MYRMNLKQNRLFSGAKVRSMNHESKFFQRTSEKQ